MRNKLVRPEQTVLIAGSGVDPEAFKPADPRPANPVPLVMFPSRMLRTKGIVEFVEAIRLLNAQNVRARYVLVGEPDRDNPATVSIEDLRGWSAETGVEYWGGQHDMAATIRSADVVCLPSYREGLPKVLLEAASCALPIVTTDVPGCRDVLVDGVTGLLVPNGDVTALAVALPTLIEDAGLRTRLGEAGRLRLVERFSLSRVVTETVDLYDRLTG